MSEQQLNQTQFQFEEPIFENPAVYESEQPPQEQVSPNTSKKKLLLIIGGIIFLLLLLLIIVVMIFRNRPAEMRDDTPIVIETSQTELGPIEQRIEDSRVLLQEADPTRQDLSFPPVDLQIRLDPVER